MPLPVIWEPRDLAVARSGLTAGLHWGPATSHAEGVISGIKVQKLIRAIYPLAINPGAAVHLGQLSQLPSQVSTRSIWGCSGSPGRGSCQSPQPTGCQQAGGREEAALI